MEASSGRERLFRAEALAATLPPLLLAAERLAATVSQGVHGRRRGGPGESFWQYRRYQPGESAHAIDWRQSAKGEPLYVRETEWEAAETVWLWRDGSASMSYASQKNGETKRQRADLLLLALSVLLVDGGERAALLGRDQPPATGRAGLLRLTHELSPDIVIDQGLPPDADMPPSSRVVLFSDALDTLDDWADRISRFANAGVRGHMVQIVDPAEETLPFDGRVLFEGAEGEAPLLIGQTGTVRDAYLRRRRHHRDGLAQLLQDHGWRFSVHHTDAPATQALLALHQALSIPGRQS